MTAALLNSLSIADLAFSASESAALRWPDPIEPSAWAERYRELESDEADRQGPWRNANAPYLAGIMDMANRRGVERIVVKKAAQVGMSEAFRNLLLCWGATDPAPCALVLPTEKKGKAIFEQKVVAAFRRTYSRHASLRALLPTRKHSITKSGLRLNNGFSVSLMYAGSPNSMASDPIKRVISDEINKYPAWSGNDGDAISLVDKRLRTFTDSIHIMFSTPTTREGAISLAFEASTHKLYFLVPCPSCEQRQRLVWDNVVVPDAIRAEENKEKAAMLVRQGDTIRYRCAGCGAMWTERDKRRAVRRGLWGTTDAGGVLPDGVIPDAAAVPEWPAGTRLGVHISALYCMWESCTLSHVAAEWLRALRRPERMFAFRTSTLGEDWEQMADRATAGEIAGHVAAATLPEGVLPWWTARVIAAVDTQKDHFWAVVRAWGPGMRSRRVWHGRVESFAELDRVLLQTPFRNEDPRFPARVCDLIVIDTGGTRVSDTPEGDAATPQHHTASRVMEVYRWALERQAVVRSIKGDARPMPGVFTRRGRGVYQTDRDKHPLPIWLLDVHHYQDELADMMRRRLALPAEDGVEAIEEPQWGLNTREDPEYARHMQNLHKQFERQGDAGSGVWRWRPIGAGARVDYRACEGYQVAAAYLAGVHLLPDLAAWRQHIEAEAAEITRIRNTPTRTAGITMADGRPWFVAQREE